jgi:hypothetical protein
MKLTSLAEATSKFGRVDFWYSDEDLVTHKGDDFHTDDQFQAGPTINQIYKFGDGTKMYLYSNMYRDDITDPAIAGIPDAISKQVVIDRDGKRYEYHAIRDFHKSWEHYIDSIVGAYDTKPFGPQEVQEFRQVFNL